MFIFRYKRILIDAIISPLPLNPTTMAKGKNARKNIKKPKKNKKK